MEYISTRKNLEDVIRAMGTLHVEQLVRYFRGAGDADKVPYYIKDLIANRILDYDDAKSRVTWHNAPALQEEAITRTCMAFWLVAYFGYQHIREIIPLKYPSQILFITHNNDSYDITVCLSTTEAKIAARTRQMFAVSGETDEVNHVAIVRSRDVGSAIMQLPGCPFDSYCIFDKEKLPTYYSE